MVGCSFKCIREALTSSLREIINQELLLIRTDLLMLASRLEF